ncbi:MAG: alpha/beta hydrolase [Pirellulaceae bacterium]
MPNLRINDVELYYEEYGQGPETIVFGHGLLLHGRMFQRQIDALSDRYRCIAFDFRTHGKSQRTAEGLDLDSLARDAAAVIESLDAAPCHYVGLSMGGFIGLRLAIGRPELLASLTLIDTSADPEPQRWRFHMLAVVARCLSPHLVIGSLFRTMFGRAFLNDPDRRDDREYWRQQFLQNDLPTMTKAITAVLARQGVYEQLDRITTPTLIVVGEEDRVTSPKYSRRMHARIAHSKLVTIPQAGHITPVETPAAVSDALSSFLAELTATRA